LNEARAVDPLIARLSDARWEVRVAVAEALGNLGDPRAVDPLLAALSDANWWVRKTTASVLGALGDPRAILSLRALLADPIPEVIQQATQAIALLEGSG
jgi:HEAT repeat protein